MRERRAEQPLRDALVYISDPLLPIPRGAARDTPAGIGTEKAGDHLAEYARRGLVCGLRFSRSFFRFAEILATLRETKKQGSTRKRASLLPGRHRSTFSLLDPGAEFVIGYPIPPADAWFVLLAIGNTYMG